MSRKLLTNIRSHTIVFLYYLMAVLTAIAIPVFTTQMEKSRESTDLANVRSAYGELISDYLTNGGASTYSKTATVAAKQTKDGWQSTTDNKAYIGTEISVGGASSGSRIEVPCHIAGTNYTLTCDASGKVTIA